MRERVTRKKDSGASRQSYLSLALKPILVAAALVIAVWAFYYGNDGGQQQLQEVARGVKTKSEPLQVEPALKRHTEIFEPGVVKVTEGVHVAVGYALANAIMLEG